MPKSGRLAAADAKLRSYSGPLSRPVLPHCDNAPPQSADGALKYTQRTRAAAGSCPPPPTLTTGTLSHTQRTTAQSVPGCQAANVKAAQSSSFCTTSRPSEPRLSSCMRQILPIAQVIDLRRKNQTVNAWKPNSRSTQTARQGRMGARAGSPGATGRPGR